MKKWSLLFLLAESFMQGNENILVRKSDERGRSHLSWLDTYYTFSFHHYYDPKFMGFRTLRVINEDVIDPKKGFGEHPHKDMEILTYMIDGTLEHKDTLGNRSQITSGEFQLMAAGSGVHHSEYNPSKDQKAHLLQIWIEPNKKDLAAGYQQKSFSQHKEGLCLVVSPTAEKGSLKINQNVKIYLGRLKEKGEVSCSLVEAHGWVQVVKGNIEVNGISLGKGDGASITKTNELIFHAASDAEFLIFELN